MGVQGNEVAGTTFGLLAVDLDTHVALEDVDGCGSAGLLFVEDLPAVRNRENNIEAAFLDQGHAAPAPVADVVPEGLDVVEVKELAFSLERVFVEESCIGHRRPHIARLVAGYVANSHGNIVLSELDVAKLSRQRHVRPGVSGLQPDSRWALCSARACVCRIGA